MDVPNERERESGRRGEKEREGDTEIDREGKRER